jgi:hypothetical protein
MTDIIESDPGSFVPAALDRSFHESEVSKDRKREEEETNRRQRKEIKERRNMKTRNRVGRLEVGLPISLARGLLKAPLARH